MKSIKSAWLLLAVLAILVVPVTESQSSASSIAGSTAGRGRCSSGSSSTTMITLSPPRRARIMVVDDDPGVVSALRLMLEDDHDVTSVSNGPEALRMLVRDATYDVVFCDLMMPEVSGKDLYEALQLNCPGHERRLVFMAGGAFPPEASRFLSRVPNSRIEKPFDMDSLRTLLQTATQ